MTKQYPIAFLPILNEEITALTIRLREEYLELTLREPSTSPEKDDTDVIEFAHYIVATTGGAIECCELCLKDWDKHDDTRCWKEELSELKDNYYRLKGLVHTAVVAGALSKLKISKLDNNKGAAYV